MTTLILQDTLPICREIVYNNSIVILLTGKLQFDGLTPEMLNAKCIIVVFPSETI